MLVWKYMCDRVGYTGGTCRVPCDGGSRCLILKPGRTSLDSSGAGGSTMRMPTANGTTRSAALITWDSMMPLQSLDPSMTEPMTPNADYVTTSWACDLGHRFDSEGYSWDGKPCPATHLPQPAGDGPCGLPLHIDGSGSDT